MANDDTRSQDRAAGAWSRRAMLGVSAGAALVPGLAGALSPSLAQAATGAGIGTGVGTAGRKPLAPRPPMGWNSWNSFATTITEAQTLEQADIMAQRLLPFGYDILTVDIQWYEPHASSYEYAAKPVPTLDGHGRLLPAPIAFLRRRTGAALRLWPGRCTSWACASAST